MSHIIRTLMITLVVVLLASPVGAQTAEQPAVVQAVMFWMDSCPHCHFVLDEVLPPIQEKYGDQFEIRLVELVSIDEVMALYDYADSIGIPKEGVAVPFLVIGEHTLIGSTQIPQELPALIDSYLAAGGVDWPDIPALEDDSLDLPAEPVAAADQTPTPSQNEQFVGPLVEAILFTTPDCYDCQLLIGEAIKPLQERFGDQFNLATVDIITSEDVEYLYIVASEYGLEKEDVELPMIIIGDMILVINQMTTDQLRDLPVLIEDYLAGGGLPAPELPARADKTTGTAAHRPSGFNLAIVILILLLAVLVYSGFVFVRTVYGLSIPIILPADRIKWLLPLLALAGLVVAGYLAYVETQALQAACGPIGDCNTVQSSPYARLFGLLPIGVLGVLGYILILAAWYIQRKGEGRYAAWAGLALFGLSFGGVLFSLYLTYLELFVIRAVCAWCLSSALIMAILAVLSLVPGLKAVTAIRNYS